MLGLRLSEAALLFFLQNLGWGVVFLGSPGRGFIQCSTFESVADLGGRLFLLKPFLAARAFIRSEIALPGDAANFEANTLDLIGELDRVKRQPVGDDLRARRFRQRGREPGVVECGLAFRLFGIDEHVLHGAAAQVIAIPETPALVEPMGRDSHLKSLAVGLREKTVGALVGFVDVERIHFAGAGFASIGCLDIDDLAVMDRVLRRRRSRF